MSFHIWECVMSSLSLSGAIVVVAVHYLLPATRAFPSDIILLIAICDFFLSLRFWLRAVAWLAVPEPHDPVRSFHVFDDGCISSLVWSAFFETASMTWNAVWCFNFILQLRYPTSDARKHMPRYHAYCWFFSCALVALQSASGYYGGVVYGEYAYCALTPYRLTNPFVLVDFVFAAIQLAVAVASLIYAQVRLRHVKAHASSRALLNSHNAYGGIYLALWSVHRIVSVVGGPILLHQVVALFWQAQAFFIACVRLAEPGLLPSLLAALGVPLALVRAWFPASRRVAPSLPSVLLARDMGGGGGGGSGLGGMGTHADDLVKPLIADYNQNYGGDTFLDGPAHSGDGGGGMGDSAGDHASGIGLMNNSYGVPGGGGGGGSAIGGGGSHISRRRGPRMAVAGSNSGGGIGGGGGMSLLAAAAKKKSMFFSPLSSSPVEGAGGGGGGGVVAAAAGIGGMGGSHSNSGRPAVSAWGPSAAVLSELEVADSFGAVAGNEVESDERESDTLIRSMASKSPLKPSEKGPMFEMGTGTDL